MLTLFDSGFGHITIAYVASNFVSDQTAAHFQTLLRNQSSDYLANVATWADNIRYTKWGHFTGPFHFIDAKDDPPSSCDVIMERDCKSEGCVISALQNYTSRLIDADNSLSAQEHEQAAKFIIHFVSDLHQPLHTEDVAKGGNGIHVKFDSKFFNLHHVWDTSIAEKMVGGVRRSPYGAAQEFAGKLVDDIRAGKFQEESKSWLDGMTLDDVEGTALIWARESNAYVCTHGKLWGERSAVVVAPVMVGQNFYYQCLLHILTSDPNSCSPPTGSQGDRRPGARLQLLRRCRSGCRSPDRPSWFPTRSMA